MHIKNLLKNFSNCQPNIIRGTEQLLPRFSCCHNLAAKHFLNIYTNTVVAACILLFKWGQEDWLELMTNFLHAARFNPEIEVHSHTAPKFRLMYLLRICSKT